MEVNNSILCHHLNIIYDGSESIKEKTSIWDKFYKELQSLSKNKIKDPVMDIVPISRTKDFAVCVTGNDLFLAINDKTNNQLSNISASSDILYVSTPMITELYKNLKMMKNNHIISTTPNGIKSLWGSYIPKVRREEDFISRLPQNIIIERTDTPFELHLINPYNNNMRCIADFEKNQIRSSKTTEQFDGAFKKCIEDVYHGQNLSGQKARSAVARYAVNNIENDTATLSKAQAKILISEGKSMVGEQTQKIEGI